MKKNIITNKITPCCGLPFSVLYWWVSNLTLNSEADRQYIISTLSQNGMIRVDAWKLLINSGTLEADASLTKAEFLAWFDCERQPSCEQLKLIIEGYQMGSWVGDLNEIRFENVLGALKITDTAPTTVGLYRLSDVGTYTNLGGLVTTAGKVNDAYFNGTTWSLIAVDLPTVSLSNLTNGTATTIASSEKATGDLRKITEDPQLVLKGAFFNNPYYEFDGSGNLFFKPTEFGGVGGNVFFIRGGYLSDWQCNLSTFLSEISVNTDPSIALFNQTSPLGETGCIRLNNATTATLYFNPTTQKFVIQSRVAQKTGWIKLIENNQGRIGRCVEENAILNSISNVQNNKNRNISFLSASAFVPNIDTATSTLDFGTDGQLIIGDVNFPLSDVKFRTVSITPSNYAGSAVRLYFNSISNEFVVRAFQNPIYGAPTRDEILIGSVRKGTNWVASFPFPVAINGSAVNPSDVARIRSTVSLIPSIEGNLPTIDETSETLDLGANPLLLVNGKTFDLASLNSSDASQYRAIPLKGSLTTSARKLYFNLATNRFELFAWNTVVTATNLVLVGGIRKATNNRIEASFPFRFRRSNDVVSTSQYFNKDVGVKFIAHRGVTFFDAPENTLDSAKDAKALGFKYSEFDCLETSDNEFVIMHDASINRTMVNNDGYEIATTVNVASTTLSNLRANYKLRGASKFQKKIPTLDEYLKNLSQLNLHPVVEVKYNMPASSVAKFVQTFRKYFKDEEVIILCFWSSVLNNIKAVMNAQFYLLGSTDVTATATANGLNANLEQNIINSTIVNYCATNNIELITWTNSLDGIAYLNRMINNGVGWISTDVMPAYDLEKIPNLEVKSKENFSDFSLVNVTASGGQATMQPNGEINFNQSSGLSTKDAIFIELEFQGKLTFQLGNSVGWIVNFEIENSEFSLVKIPMLNKVAGAFSLKLKNTGTTNALVNDLNFRIFNL